MIGDLVPARQVAPAAQIEGKLRAELAPARPGTEHPLDTLAGLVDAETGAAVLRWLAGARRASAATRRAYLDDVNRWAAYLVAAGVARPVPLLRAATRDVVTGWCVWATTTQASARGALSPRTRARRLWSLSSLFRHAAKTDSSIVNPVDGEDHVPQTGQIDSGTRPRGATRALEPAEVARMRAACTGERDLVVLGLLYEPALRVTELVDAHIDDLEWTEHGCTLWVRRKGGKPAGRQVTARTAAALRAYLGGRAEGPLLLDTKGAPLDRFDVVRILRRLARRAGVPNPDTVTPHVLRASAITALCDHVPIQEVQAYAGHASPKTTTGYWERRNGAARDRALAERLAHQLDELDAGLGPASAERLPRRG